MAQNSENKNTLKNFIFIVKKYKVLKKITKKLVISNVYLNYHFSIKNLNN